MTSKRKQRQTRKTVQGTKAGTQNGARNKAGTPNGVRYKAGTPNGVRNKIDT